MRMQSVLAAALLILIASPPTWSQYAQYPTGTQSAPTMPYGSANPAPPGSYNLQEYSPAQQQSPYPYEQQGAGSDAGQWPYYPYPQYHNPYYDERIMRPRDALSGTIDWLLTLPSNVMDRVSNFLDGTVFPQAPATRGARPDSQPLSSPQPGGGTATTPPQAAPAAPAAPAPR